MATIKHKFVSPKTDGSDNSLVRPTNWNADHDFLSTGDGVVIGRATGAGAGALQELPMGALLPTGIILPFGGSTAPAGFLLCNGALLLRTDYPALFTAIGVAFNPAVDGSHFNLPDLRGRVPCGVDGGTGRISNVVANIIGSVGGQQQAQAGVYGYVDASGSASVSGTVSGVLTGTASAGAGSGAGSSFLATSTYYMSGSMSGSASVSGSIRNDGNNLTSTINTVQPTLAINYVIKT
jgi:microcystin-dependent protein